MKRTPAEGSLRTPLKTALAAVGLTLAVSLSACSLQEDQGAWSPPSSPTSGEAEPTTEAPESTEAPAAGDLEGTWELETDYLQDAARATGSGGASPTLTFEADGSLAVDTGCNTGGGTFEVSGDQITLSPIALTLRACEGQTGALEAVVVGLLGAEELSFRIEESVLMLTAEDGTTLAFGQVDAAEGDSAPTTDQPTSDQPTSQGPTQTGAATSQPTQTGAATSQPTRTRTATAPAGTGNATSPAPTTGATGPARTTAP